MSNEIIAVVRQAHLAFGWPSVFRFLWSEVGAIVEAFDRSVAPLVDQTIDEPRRRREIARTLLSTSVKVALAMSGYARVADVAFNADLAVLGSSFTRVYDDLFDNFDSPRLDQRLADLFDGHPFRPGSDAESMLLALYRVLETTLARDRSDPVFAVLRRLHRFQIRSRRQRGPEIAPAELRWVTRGKGGLGTIALFALLRPRMSATEQRLLMELGDILQLLDDYHDAALDRANGVVTEVTLGTCRLSDLSRRIGRLRREFSRRYPGRSSHRLFGMLYLMLVSGLIYHRAEARRRRRGSGRPVAPAPDDRRPHRLLFDAAGNIRPAGDAADSTETA